MQGGRERERTHIDDSWPPPGKLKLGLRMKTSLLWLFVKTLSAAKAGKFELECCQKPDISLCVQLWQLLAEGPENRSKVHMKIVAC